MPHSRSISIWLAIPALALSVSGFAAARTSTRAGRRGPSSTRTWPRHRQAKGKAGKPQPASDPVALGRRDPFAPLLSDRKKPGREVIRPPGKAGLTIGEIDVQGTVRGPHGAVAVVSSAQGHVYFLRPGDRLFDGTVEKINLNSVEFVERARDGFGRPFERRVLKAVQSPQGAKR